MAYIIGVDIGGTKISVVMSRTSGKIIEKCVLQTQVNRAAEKSIDDILVVIKEMLRVRQAEKHLEEVVPLQEKLALKRELITKENNVKCIDMKT